MKIKTPGFFFETLKKVDLLEPILPSLHQLVGLEGGPHHNETVFEHVMLAGDSLPRKNPLLRLTSFLHDTGKKEACQYVKGTPVYHGHERLTDSLEKDLIRLKLVWS